MAGSYEVYDIEVTKSCITYTGFCISTKKYSQFVIHKDRDETIELINHLKSLAYGIGFNNINFDYPVLHYLINIANKCNSVEEIIELVFNEAQRIIDEQNRVEFFSTVAIKESECYFKQIDLFKIWHYNNPARRTSLKALEISMNLPNVMEMEVDYKRDNITLEEVKGILEYNKNDVEATYQFYLKSVDKLRLRTDLNKQYNLNCLNFPDVKIGENLMIKLYSEKTGMSWWDVKKLRTYRSEIKLKECIFPYIEFKSEPLKKLLDKIQSTTIKNTKGEFSFEQNYHGIKLIYGTGGIHACTYAGIYESNETHIIKTADVASLYPNLGIQNRVYPEHLGEIFCEIYEKDIVDVRMKAKKAGNKLIADALKLAANGAYGKSNDENSFLYDPKYTMQITVSGQLSITMLIEDLVLEIPNCKILMVNTDGLEVIIRRDQQDLYYDICKKWEKKTKLTLEFDDYQKMVIGDVNNYTALYTNGKKKYKGRFEIDKVVGDEPAYHKDNSFRIVPYALSRFFLEDIPVEVTIREHTNIYDFCGREKFKGQDYGETHTLSYDDLGNPFDKIEKQQRNTRFYITNEGSTFIKRYGKGTSEMICKGFQVKIFNRYEEKSIVDYNIDYQFYIKLCYREINNIISKQTTLNF